MTKQEKNKIIVQLVIMALLILYVLACGCGVDRMQEIRERRQVRKDQREMRGEGRHKWKGGPFPQNKQFTGY